MTHDEILCSWAAFSLHNTGVILPINTMINEDDAIAIGFEVSGRKPLSLLTGEKVRRILLQLPNEMPTQ